jgi:tetratricopeptide (TPR) repeat protein
MKKILLSLLFAGLLYTAEAQDFHLRFSQAIDSGDSASQRTVLEEWYKFNPTGAEYYIDWFNYYVNQALSQSMTLTADEREESSQRVSFTDSTGDISDFLVMGVPSVNPLKADSALMWIDKGLKQHPYRLDMWMGRTHFLGMVMRWDDFEQSIEELIDRYAASKPKQWTYPGVGLFDRDLFSQAVLEYQRTLIEETDMSAMEQSDSLMLQRMANIAQRMLKHYPKDIYQLNMMAVYYNALGNNQECLRYLLKAEKQDRRDCTVLSNIANIYHNLGNYKQERKYLKKVLKYGDEEEQEYARYFLQSLDEQGL